MYKIIDYIESNDFGELESSIKHFNGKPRVTLNYILKSNSKRQRKLKVITIEKEDQWFKLSMKYANDGNLEAECKKALKQIDDTGYAEALHQDGICKILKYAIACYKKTCKIMLEAEKC